jgi:hypothetical protein
MHLQPPKLRAFLAAIAVGSSLSLAAETVIFQESFETDGLDTRYKVQNPSDDGSTDFFARRQTGSPGVRARDGALDGDWHWSGRDIDGDGVAVDDLEANQARLWFAPVDVSGYQNLEIRVVAAQGGNEVEFDDRIIFQYRFDGDDTWTTRGQNDEWTSEEEELTWVTAGGFRGRHTNSAGWYFEGDDTTVPPPGTPRLSQTFKEFSWQLWGKGERMEFRLFQKSNGSTEEYHFDNLRIIGTADLGTLTPTLNKTVFTETEGAGAGLLTIAISPAAPAGGVEVQIFNTDIHGQHVAGIPQSVVIPEGQSSVEVPFDIVHDERFSGMPIWRFQLTAEGYGRSEVTYQVVNIDPRPRLLITELHPAVAGGSDRFVGANHYADTNGDGFRHSSDDEFFEVINLDDKAVDMSHWWTIDDLGIRHVFPAGTVLQPGGVLVVFGGGSPTGKFGGAQVQVSSLGNIGMGNGGDNFTIVAGGAVVREVIFDGVLGLTLESLVIPPEQIFQLGNNVDEGGFGPESGGAYVKMSDVHPDDGPPRPADEVNDLGTGAGPFFAPGYYPDGSGRPLMEWANEIHLDLASDAAMTPEQFNADLAIEEGAWVDITIRLETAAPVDGLPVRLSAIENRSVHVPPSSDPLHVAFNRIDRAGSKIRFEQDEIVLNGTTPVTVRAYVDKDEVGEGRVVARIMAHADGALFGLALLEIIDTYEDPTAVVINEVFGGVTGSGMDPNGNGIIEEPVDDQYIELVNTSDLRIHIGGWRLFSWSTRNRTGDELVHVFPNGTHLQPGAAIIVMGGGDEAAMNANSAANYGGAQVQVANVGGNGVNIREDFEGFVRIQNRHGKVMNTVFIPSSLAAQGMSLTRFPDLTGVWADDIDPLESDLPATHLDVSAAFEFFSAGRLVSGEPFAGNTLPVVDYGSALPTAQYSDDEGYTLDSTYGRIYTAGWPWSHENGRWLYNVADGEGGRYLFDRNNTLWLWTHTETYPYYYNLNTGAWLRF